MAEIYLYDEIGPSYWGMTDDKWLVGELAKVSASEDITLRINSPGGDAFMGVSMMNAVARRGNVDIEIDALAASAATIVAMGGRAVRMAENAMFMVHRAWSIAIGNANQFAKMADTLTAIDGNIAATYAKRTGKTSGETIALMDAETWMTAAEAEDFGFVDEVVSPLDIAMAWSDILPFTKAPAEIEARRVRKTVESEPKTRQINRLIASCKIARRKLSA